jgi:hypothetical protein
MTAVVVKDSNRKCVGNFQWELSSPKNACCKHVGQFPMTHTANVSAMSNGSCLCRKVNATNTSENVRYGSCGRQCLNLRAYQQHQCYTAVVWLDSMRSACLQVAVASSLSNYMASAQWMTPSNKVTRASMTNAASVRIETVLEPCRKSSYPFLLCYLLFSFAGWLKLVDLETTKEHRSISITRTAILARLGCGLQAINVLLLRGHKQRAAPVYM